MEYSYLKSIIRASFSESNRRYVNYDLEKLVKLTDSNEKHVISFLKEKEIAFFTPLTPQETAGCDLIIYGQTTDGIAAEMGISVSSVKTYRNRAYRKLKINSKSELFAMIINCQIYQI